MSGSVSSWKNSTGGTISPAPFRGKRSSPCLGEGWCGFGAELVLVERGVEAALVEQVGVGAVLDEVAVVEDEDHVGREDCGKTMCDHDRGAAVEQRLGGGLDGLRGDGGGGGGRLLGDAGGCGGRTAAGARPG